MLCGAGSLTPAEHPQSSAVCLAPPSQAYPKSNQYPSPKCVQRMTLHSLSLVWTNLPLLVSQQSNQRTSAVSNTPCTHSTGRLYTPLMYRSCTHHYRHQSFGPPQEHMLKHCMPYTPYTIQIHYAHTSHPHHRYTHYTYSIPHTTYDTTYHIQYTLHIHTILTDTPTYQYLYITGTHSPHILQTTHVSTTLHTHTYYSHICTKHHVHLTHISYACIPTQQQTHTYHLPTTHRHNIICPGKFSLYLS